jgi:hypothetical protein
MGEEFCENCPACKRAQARKKWKGECEAYEKGKGPHPGEGPGHVNRGHIKDCPGYRQKGSGPTPKNKHSKVTLLWPIAPHRRKTKI